MNHWTDTPTRSHQNISAALDVVDSILSYVKLGVGKPSAEERALFAAAVVFTYGIWEHFVEQTAIEVAQQLGATIAPESVPGEVKASFAKMNAWELTVTPGWRTL